MKLATTCLLVSSLIGCALRPAPITTLDVCAAVNACPAPERPAKAKELLGEIDKRQRALRISMHIPTYYWVFLPIETGITWLAFIPARRTTFKEVAALEEKKGCLQAVALEVDARPSPTPEGLKGARIDPQEQGPQEIEAGEVEPCMGVTNDR